ncbi:MAG: hypothetical protein WCZ23_06310 [Rhodospirillaceae bacterium]
MRKLLVLVGVGLLAACLKTSPPSDVTGFVDSAGELAGATEYCDPVLAARATACARNVVATWPGGLRQGERLAALERLDVVRQKAANQPQSCPAKLASLRAQSFWSRCYVPG